MAELDHTIVESTDPDRSAAFLADILGLAAPRRLGPFAMVSVGAGTTLDFIAVEGRVHPQHYAFRVTEADFDAAFGRIYERGLGYWGDPGKSEPGVVNDWDGGRGTYFEDPDGHLLEIITRSYGTGGSTAAHPHPLVAGS